VSHVGHRATLISDSVAFSQTPAKAARLQYILDDSDKRMNCVTVRFFKEHTINTSEYSVIKQIEFCNDNT